MTTDATATSPAPSAPTAPPSAAADTGWLRRHRLPAALVLAAVFIGVLGPLWLSAYTGSLAIPHNDTWAFSRTAQIFAHTGHIVLFNWNAMALLGMIIPLGPFGGSITVQSCIIAVLALVALAALFDLFQVYGGPRRAALGVLLVAIWPGFGLISTSLMTDIPALAAVTVSLALGRRALERGSFPLLALTAIVGFWGFSVREQVIAAPVGVFAAALLQRRFRTRASLKRMVWILLPLSVLAAGFEVWRRSLAGGGSPSFDFETFPGVKSVLFSVLSGWLLLGLMLSPLVLLIARPFQWDRTRLYVSGGTFFVLANAAFWGGLQLPQNYLSIAGSYPGAFLGTRPDVVPQTVWDLLTPLACISGGLLAGVLMGRLRRLRPELAMYAVFMICGTFLEVVEGQILFDRYVLPMALPVIALLLSEPLRSPEADASLRERRTRLALGGASGLFVAVVTTLMTANALSFDAATWHAAEAVVSSGDASVDYVDAGLDWTGYYSADGMQDQPDLYAEPGIFSYSPSLGRDLPCYVVASRPQEQPSWTLVGTPAYRVYGFFGSTEILDVYSTGLTVCQ
jgi:hypothetical protein